ncbi:hypothetical protein [Kitasatospora sp. LaBMicrA B282]|uniref:hypothetical protein n=1 Tax=Kitasatospora sp. LaBMicrA B282 TaxID=3420949 RepID=UPI003D10C062
MPAATQPGPPTRRRRTVSPAELAAIQADYDPLFFEKSTNGLRGTPTDWPFCECDRDFCPDKGKADGSALGPALGQSVLPGLTDAA